MRISLVHSANNCLLMEAIKVKQNRQLLWLVLQLRLSLFVNIVLVVSNKNWCRYTAGRLDI